MILASRSASSSARTRTADAHEHRSILAVQQRHSRFSACKPAGPKHRGSVDTQPETQGQAFEGMVVASRTKFLVVANAILRNREDAEDAVQDAILSGYLHLPSFEGRSALTTWFTRIVMNSALMIRRKQKVSGMSPQPESGTSDDAWRIERIQSSQPGPEMVYAKRETFKFINEALAKMKPGLRQAFTMTYCEEMSGPGACALLGASSAAFKSRLQRARRHLDEASRTRVVPIHKACRSFGQSYPEKSTMIDLQSASQLPLAQSQD